MGMTPGVRLKECEFSRHLDDHGAGNLVVPHLTFLVLQHPEAPDAKRRKRKQAREDPNHGIREPGITASDPDDAQADDDSAQRGEAGPHPLGFMSSWNGG